MDSVHDKMYPCSLTCRDRLNLSQSHLMRIMSVDPLIARSRRFGDMRALLQTNLRVKDGIEALCVNG